VRASLVVVGVIASVALAVAWVWDGKRAAADVPVERPDEIDPFAGGYPVPPLPGQHLREPSSHDPSPLEPDPQGAPTWADAAGHSELTDQEATRG